LEPFGWLKDITGIASLLVHIPDGGQFSLCADVHTPPQHRNKAVLIDTTEILFYKNALYSFWHSVSSPFSLVLP
jgi:hypothetical protein